MVKKGDLSNYFFLLHIHEISLTWGYALCLFVNLGRTLLYTESGIQYLMKFLEVLSLYYMGQTYTLSI